VPVPDYTAKCTILVTTGKAKYDATKKAIVSHTAVAGRAASCWCAWLPLATNRAFRAWGAFGGDVLWASDHH
jgi:hypothetical protein